MNVSPEKAALFLTKNKKNRRVDKTRVQKYVNDMKNGHWCLNGDAIRFCEEGYLIDGQHRLNAIIETGRDFVFLVIHNVESESKRTIDTGKARTGSDVLSMFSGVGTRDSGALSSAISKLMLYDAERSIAGGGASSAFTSNSAIEEFYKKNSVQLNNSLEFLSEIIDTNAMLLSRAESLFLHVVFSRIDAVEANEFIKKIITGLGMEAGSNEHLLRTLLTKKAMKNIKISTPEVLYTVIRAWNYNRRGKRYASSDSLKYSKNDTAAPVAS